VRFPLLAVCDVASATERTVKKIDAIAKIIVVKTAKGAEHTVHFLDRAVNHGVEFLVYFDQLRWHRQRVVKVSERRVSK